MPSDNKSSRPVISAFESPVEFLRAMIEYRKRTEKSFSIQSATTSLRKVSPALVSLILSRKRKITLDRVDEISKLIQLNVQEKIYFRNWVAKENGEKLGEFRLPAEPARHQRKEVSTSILNDWINVYVKDCFQLPRVQENPDLVYRYLASYAQPLRIRKAMDFLLREGHLRRTLEGKIVVEAQLAIADPQVPSKKIRQFHKGALGVAKAALDLFPPQERIANTLIIPLNEKSYGELVEIIDDFKLKLQEFAAHNQEAGDRLYQFILNLSPTGGKVE